MQCCLHGDRPERFDKGWTASGGQLILDLEDAVSLERKAEAREAVANWLSVSGHRPLVRLNSTDSPCFRQDCAALAGLAVAGLVVPKVNAAFDLDAVRGHRPVAALFPLIESPQGLESATEIARAPGVCQLVLGALDLHAECGIEFPHPALLEHARLRLALASRVAGIPAPVDTAHPAVRDLEEVACDAQAAARLGFAAKRYIHPAQLDSVNRPFARRKNRWRGHASCSPRWNRVRERCRCAAGWWLRPWSRPPSPFKEGVHGEGGSR